MPSEPQELVFPLRGISEGWSYGRQPEGTCPDAQNVVPIDSIGTRIRGGQRWGLSKYFDTVVSGANKLQCLTSIASVTNTLPIETVENFTAADGKFYSLLTANWDHYTKSAGNDWFDAETTADADSPNIVSNELLCGQAATNDSMHVWTAVSTPVGEAYTVSFYLKSAFTDGNRSIGHIALRIHSNPTVTHEFYTVRIYRAVAITPRFYLNKYDSDYSNALIDSVILNAGAIAAIQAGTTIKLEIASDGDIECFVGGVSQGTLSGMAAYGTYTGIGIMDLGDAFADSEWYMDDFTAPSAITRLSNRVQRVLAISNGDVKVARPGTALHFPIGGGGDDAFDTSEIVRSRAIYKKIYFCNGLAAGYKVFDNQLCKVSAWTPDSGSLPVGTVDATKSCRIITSYRGRIVLAGLTEFPHNWYMSKVNDPLDWDYGATTSAIMAVAGNNTDAGECPDIITCLASCSDDLMYIGGDHSLWSMTGDPADRGRIDNISEAIGISGPDAYTFDSSGVFYFFGMGTIWKLVPGGIPEALSRTRLDATLAAIDLTTHIVHLHWDNVRNGLFIFVVPGVEGATTHYYWDQQTDSFWKIKFPNGQGPTQAHAFDGDKPDDTALLLGGWDGYIRHIDPSTKNDDATAIDSYLLYPPMTGGPERNIRINRISAILDTNSDDVTLSTYAEDTVQKVIAASEDIEAAVNITAVSQVAKTFTVAENWSGRAAGDNLLVAGSTGNDGSYILASTAGAGPTVLTVVEAIPDDTVDGTIQYRDQTRFSQVLSGGRNTVFKRVAGNAVMVKLYDSTSAKSWAIENIVVNTEIAGRTRKNQL